MITVKEEIIDLAITRDDLLRLSQYHNKSCISIYLPTHRLGVETLKGQDALNLKNQLKKIRNKLSGLGMNTRKIGSLVDPVVNLVDKTDFWRHQSGGLAVFASDGVFERYIVPERFDEFNYLSSEFYVKPLIPLFNGPGSFYLLTLKKDNVRLFAGNKYSLTEVDVQGIVPQRLEDSVGYDYEQKQLQHRTVGGVNKPGSFHGHGESESRDKNELLVFFREIDKGIMSKLHDHQEPPLVLCCLDHYVPIYSEACTHKNLFREHISFNPADLDIRSLHENALEILEPYFRKDLEDKMERFMIALDKGRASSNVREIIPAAVQGKVDTLFMERKAEVYGVYNPASGTVSVQENHGTSNFSLTNLAAKKVFEQGGTVYILERGEMPDGLEYISALFRY